MEPSSVQGKLDAVLWFETSHVSWVSKLEHAVQFTDVTLQDFWEFKAFERMCPVQL